MKRERGRPTLESGGKAVMHKGETVAMGDDVMLEAKALVLGNAVMLKAVAVGADVRHKANEVAMVVGDTDMCERSW